MGKTEDTTFLKTLELCTKFQDLARGKQIHACMVISKIKIPVFFLNVLADMYSKCGSLEDSCTIFDDSPKHDLVSWNIMICSYTRYGFPEAALSLYRQMITVGFFPDNVTFVGVFDACAAIGDLRLGAETHVVMTFSRAKLASTSSNALINMYAKCGSMDLACKVFDIMDDRNVVSWNAILTGFSTLRDTNKVLEVYNKMMHYNVKADNVSYLSVLNACSFLGDVGLIKDVHLKIRQEGIQVHLVLENALLDAYVKCGSADIALQVFNQMLIRDVVSWSTIIALHSSVNSTERALDAFNRMHCEGTNANDVTILAVLGAFRSSGELQRGKHIHASIVCSEWEKIVNVGNALVAMYSKCGTLADACRSFHNMKTWDTITWNTIMSSYAEHGHAKKVLEVAQRMREAGIELDSASLSSILSVCSRAGLIIEAFAFLCSVEMEKGFVLNSNHYACMVDLLARAGLLQSAEKWYSCVPDEPNLASWRALLGACKLHRDSKLAKAVAHTKLNTLLHTDEVQTTISNMHLFLAGD